MVIKAITEIKSKTCLSEAYSTLPDLIEKSLCLKVCLWSHFSRVGPIIYSMTYQDRSMWRYHGTCWHLAYYQIAIPLLCLHVRPHIPIYLANGAVSILSRNGFLIYLAGEVCTTRELNHVCLTGHRPHLMVFIL